MKKPFLIFASCFSVFAYSQQVKSFGAGTFAAGAVGDKLFTAQWAKEVGKSYGDFTQFGGTVGEYNCTLNADFCYKRQFGSLGPHEIAVFHYGTNDASPHLPVWKQKYEQFIQESFIALGYSKSNLYITTIPHSPGMDTDPDAAKTAVKYRTATNPIIRTIAQEMGIQLFDIEQIIEAQPNRGVGLYADIYHLNEAGQQVLLNEFRKLFGATPPLPAAPPSPLPIKINSYKIKRVQ